MRLKELRTRGVIQWRPLRFGLPGTVPPLGRVVSFGFWLARRRMIAGATKSRSRLGAHL